MLATDNELPRFLDGEGEVRTRSLGQCSLSTHLSQPEVGSLERVTTIRLAEAGRCFTAYCTECSASGEVTSWKSSRTSTRCLENAATRFMKLVDRVLDGAAGEPKLLQRPAT